MHRLPDVFTLRDLRRIRIHVFRGGWCVGGGGLRHDTQGGLVVQLGSGHREIETSGCNEYGGECNILLFNRVLSRGDIEAYVL